MTFECVETRLRWPIHFRITGAREGPYSKIANRRAVPARAGVAAIAREIRLQFAITMVARIAY